MPVPNLVDDRGNLFKIGHDRQEVKEDLKRVEGSYIRHSVTGVWTS